MSQVPFGKVPATGVARLPGEDLVARKMDRLDWTDAKRAESLGVIYEHVTTLAHDTQWWYLRAKLPKRRMAVYLRVLAIVTAAVAGVLPILAQIYQRDGKPIIPPAWASILLACTAASVGLDRFFGFSSAWIRFITAELKVQQLLQDFQIDWESVKLGWKGSMPTDEHTQNAIGRCRTFLGQVNAIVQDETKSWVQEFQDSIKQLDEASKAKLTTPESGALLVEVANGDGFKDGWALSVDGGTARRCMGKTAAVVGLSPGLHAVVIEAREGDLLRRAETAVKVAVGETGKVSLTPS